MAHVCLVFPSQPVSVVLELPSNVDEKPEKQGFITCVMRGAMDGISQFPMFSCSHCFSVDPCL